MTEPVDPNEPSRFGPPPYQPPPASPAPSYPPPAYPPPSAYPPPPNAGGPYAGGPYAGGPYAGGPYAGGPYAGGPYAGGPPPYPGTQPAGWVGPDGTWTALEPTPPTRRRNTGLIAVAIAVVLVAAGVGAFFLLRSDNGKSGTKATKAPGSFAGYTLLDNAAATQVKNSMRSLGGSMGGSAGRLFDAATIAVYAHDSGDQPVLITLTVPTSAAGSDHTPEDITTQMLSGATASNDSFPAGSHGGSLRCGLAQFGAVSETMCAWSDPNRSGLLVSVRESLRPADLAQLAQRFRDAVE